MGKGRRVIIEHGVVLNVRKNLENNYNQIIGNLKELKGLTVLVTAEYPLAANSPKQRKILYISSCLYEYYQLVEDSLLIIARTVDLWIPGSLDWHYRLIRLMMIPVPDKRPAILSKVTALQLDHYLVLYLNYHYHSIIISPCKLDKMISSLQELTDRLESELTRFINQCFSGKGRAL